MVLQGYLITVKKLTPEEEAKVLQELIGEGVQS